MDGEVDNLRSAARKESVDGAERAESGRAFQSTTVLGKYEYLSTSVREESGVNVWVPHCRVCLVGWCKFR